MSVSVIAFDVNETMLDLRSLDPHFEELLGDAKYRPLWFAQMLQLSFVGGLTGEYVDFSTAQRAALHMVGARIGVDVSEEQAEAMVDRMTELPPHAEVQEALQTLSASPYRMVALVNSPMEVGEMQLRFAGIRQYFDSVVSADSVRALKPAAAPYRAVADAYGVDTPSVRLVAAHSWDVSGALAASCRAAFVARPGSVLSPVGKQPDIVESDLLGVVRRIIETDRV